MAPPKVIIDYNSPDFKFPDPANSSPCYKRGFISKELHSINGNQPR